MAQAGNEQNDLNEKSGQNKEETKSRISNRGFASMTPEQQRQIASKGGQAAHKKGVAHEWTSEEARAAGKKGGQASKKTSRDEANTETTQQTGAPQKTDISRSTNVNPPKEDPDATARGEHNPQKPDNPQNSALNR